MKFQNLFFGGENKKNKINLPSAEFAHGVLQYNHKEQNVNLIVCLFRPFN